VAKRKEKRRRYLLNKNVSLAAYYGSPGAMQWLAWHVEESYYSSLLKMELRRLGSGPGEQYRASPQSSTC